MPTSTVGIAARSRAFALVAMIVVSLTVGAQASNAAAFDLPLTVYGDIALDESNSQVFVSGGASVAVRNLDGTTKATIGGLTNAGGMVISGTTLYVAQCGTASIAVYDTVTLAAGTPIALGSVSPRGQQGNPGRPCGLTLAGGRLWFSTSDTWGSVASVQPGTGAVQTYLPNIYYGALIDSNPANANQIVIADGSSSPPYIGIYNVDPSTGSLTLSGTRFWDQDGGSTRDIRFTPDGASLIVANGAPYFVRKLDATTKSQQTSYGTGAYPVAGAMSANGSWLAAGKTGSGYDAFVYPAAGGTAPNRYELGSGRDMPAGGVIMSTDNTRLYAMSYVYATPTPRLHVFDAPTVGTTSLTVTAPATGSSTAATTISGALAFSGDGALAGQSIAVSATPPNGSPISVGTATTTSTGSWSINAPAGTFPSAGTWTLTATSSAFAPFPAADATRTISITVPQTTLTINGPVSILAGSSAALSGTLSYSPTASAASRIVTIDATPPSGGSPQALGTTMTTSTGSWSFNVSAGTLVDFGDWTLAATVAVNGSYPARTATRTLTARPGVTTLSLTAPSTLERGASVNVSGALGYSDGRSNAARTITISTASAGAPATAMGTATTAVDGSWSYMLPAAAFTTDGTWTVSASVAASSPWPAGATQATIAVSTLSTIAPPPTTDPTPTTDPIVDSTTTSTTTTSTTTTRTNETTTVVKVLKPTAAADRLLGSALADVIRALRGNDLVRGAGGADRLFGDAGNDVLEGGAGNDYLDGGIGNDIMRGGVGNDTIICGPGTVDKAYGDAGADRLTCYDRRGGDIIDGGIGTDVCTGDRTDIYRNCERVIRK